MKRKMILCIVDFTPKKVPFPLDSLDISIEIQDSPNHFGWEQQQDSRSGRVLSPYPCNSCGLHLRNWNSRGHQHRGWQESFGNGGSLPDGGSQRCCWVHHCSQANKQRQHLGNFPDGRETQRSEAEGVLLQVHLREHQEPGQEVADGAVPGPACAGGEGLAGGDHYPQKQIQQQKQLHLAACQKLKGEQFQH